MIRGSIVLADLPKPLSSPGREQFGHRPVLIVQSAAAKLATLLIVPFTTNLIAIKFQGSLRVSPSKTNGLTQESIALIHQLRALDKRRLKKTIGQLDVGDLQRIDQELRVILDI